MTHEMQPILKSSLQDMYTHIPEREAAIRRIVRHIYMHVSRSATKGQKSVECFAYWDNAKLYAVVSRQTAEKIHPKHVGKPFWQCPVSICMDLSYVDEILSRLRKLFPDCVVSFIREKWRWDDPEKKTSGKNGVAFQVDWS